MLNCVDVFFANLTFLIVMIRVLPLLFTSLFLFSHLQAQNKVVFKNGEVVETKIKFREDLNSFYYQKEGNWTYVDPDVVKTLITKDGREYISSTETKFNERKTFYEYLCTGLIDVYYYEDSVGTYYLFNKYDSLQLVAYERKPYTDGQSSTLVELKNYKQVLPEVFGDALDFSSVRSNGYDPIHIIKLSRKYHEKKKDASFHVFDDNYLTRKVYFGGTLGFAEAKPTLGSDLYNVPAKNLHQTTVTLGLKMMIRLTPHSNRVFLITGLETVLSTLYGSAGFKYGSPSTDKKIYTANFNNYHYNFLRAPLRLSINLSPKPKHPYLLVGGAIFNTNMGKDTFTYVRSSSFIRTNISFNFALGGGYEWPQLNGGLFRAGISMESFSAMGDKVNLKYEPLYVNFNMGYFF